MKKHTFYTKRHLSFIKYGVLSLVFLAGPLLLGGCINPLLAGPDTEPGQSVLRLSLKGDGVDPSLSARTLLPLNPEFTKYELITTDSSGNPLEPGDPGYLEPYAFYNSIIQIPIPEFNGIYYFAVRGYAGDKLTAKSVPHDAPQRVDVTDGIAEAASLELEFTLKNYWADEEPGIISFSLSWDSLSRMPSRAELFILQDYTVDAQGEPQGEPLHITDIQAQGLTPGSDPGTIKLLHKDIAFASLNGSLTLPAGQYWLSMSVTMDEGAAPVPRGKIAHVYSNLTTPAAFHYGGGDLLISNTSPDPGAGFITAFSFTETPNADTVIGSVAGADGTRQIMVMVPEGTNLQHLTPVVATAEGASITSPLPSRAPELGQPPVYGSMDFSSPMVWTAQAKNGIVQKYTVVVSVTPDTSSEKLITNFLFKEHPNATVVIHHGDPEGAAIANGTIEVTVPYGISPAGNFTPFVTIIGKRVVYGPKASETALDGSAIAFPKTFRVYAGNETYREYAVTVKAALNTAAKITKFVIDGFPDREGISGSPQGDYYPITVTLPYGTALTNLKPLIQYEGKTLSPGSGVVRNFSLPVEYIVHAEDYDANAGTGHSARYKVTVKNDAADSIRGIFDFVITNYPNCRVAIGQNPRGDGKIPIVIQVPHALTTTDLLNMIPEITLASPTSRIDHYTAPRNTTPIPFSDQGNPQEAVYTVTAQDSSTQDYVVLIHRDVQYYYVKGSGSDVDPDTDNGGSETAPFKTLAHAVYQASRHADINHIFVIGELNNSTEAGAWEQATASDSGFQPSGGDAESVFNLIGTTDNDSDSPDYKTAVKTITITGVGSNAVLRGTTDKRVISITGGARLVFENITITGGNSSGNGGGVYISGNSNVKFSSCSITGNTAKLGGGVYIEDSNIDYDSEFTLMGGTISGNTATGSATALDTMGGGGGVYIKGNALFWLSSGSVSDNTASHGAGGGVLVNGNPHHDPDGHEDGFLMSGGSVSGNKAPNGIKPHGGGGVYVARGAFEMQGGEITGNSTNRQGGGVFVYWATSTTETARFTASGNSSITGNAGVGSSAAICNRGITEMRGNAQADKIYVWNNESAVAQSFTLAENARAGGVVLAHSASNSNVITIASPSSITGNSRIAIIDLEGHLNNSDKLSGTIAGDWLGKKLLVVSSGSPAIYIDRLPLGTFVGTATSNIAASYKISVSGSAGILVAK